MVFDIGVFKNKVSMSLDLFKDVRSDILFNSPVPVEYGLAPPKTNKLEVGSEGFEFLINYQETFNELKVNAGFTLSSNKNEVLDLAGEGPFKSGSSFTEVGGAINLPYGYRSAGLLTQEDIDNGVATTSSNEQAGNIKYVDQDNSGTIDGDDRVILQDENPYRYGFNLGLEI